MEPAMPFCTCSGSAAPAVCSRAGEGRRSDPRVVRRSRSVGRRHAQPLRRPRRCRLAGVARKGSGDSANRLVSRPCGRSTEVVGEISIQRTRRHGGGVPASTAENPGQPLLRDPVGPPRRRTHGCGCGRGSSRRGRPGDAGWRPPGPMCCDTLLSGLKPASSCLARLTSQSRALPAAERRGSSLACRATDRLAS